MSLLLSNCPYHPGQSLWRLNTFLLKSPEIAAEVQSLLVEFFILNKGSVSSPATLWCAHKAVLRGIWLQIAAREKKKWQQSLHNVLNDLKIADRELKTSPSDENKRRHSLLQEKLRTFYLHEYERSLKRLKMNFYSQGGRNGKFLANRVRILQARNKIPYITSAPGNKIYDTRGTADAFADYYSALYNLKNEKSLPAPSPSAIQVFLDKISLPTGTLSQLDSLNSPSLSPKLCPWLRQLNQVNP